MEVKFRRNNVLWLSVSCLVLVCVWWQSVSAQVYSPDQFSEMKWRGIGPHRGGRTRAICGVRTQLATFYLGVCNGGVWKTTDAGRTWLPIFDDQPTGSIGSIAVAPSDPNVIYVGSGEALHRPDLSVGDGIYKSSDAGSTWTHLGLRDGQQIPSISVDPNDPDRLFVAVLGHPYGANKERGIYRSTDGGLSFEQVLFVDEHTGGNDVDIDPDDPSVVYATLWEAMEGPWENAEWSGTGGGIFKSTDGGTTWRKLTKGLPEEKDGGVIQVNMTISPADTNRIYATVASGQVGIYRSDNAGESWRSITDDRRPAGRIGGGDLPMPVAHPTDVDTVISTSTVAWKSIDGGRTWSALKGAPGGDDYQNGWINPDYPEIIGLASDQGGTVTVNGGLTWSSWYNQPTAQLYHVAADNSFPYRVYSGQQESGSVGIASRGNYGQITSSDWQTVAVDEYGYVAPDPLDSDIIYGGRSVVRFDRRTGQVSEVGPAGEGFRRVRTQPVVFSAVDQRVLYYANNYLWKTVDGGQNWDRLSDDMTRKSWEPPASIGKYREQPDAQSNQRGVIYTVAPSYQNTDRIWIGTDDGLVHTTSDGGKTWNDVTPAVLGPWMKVSMIDAGRFDNDSAYLAINTLRLDDMQPHIYRTHDGGANWTEIVSGIPAGAPINVVREDPQRKGLLFAGSETAVYVSFDDGDHWQSLRLNMPASSVRDLIVKDDDLVAATHGRGFWILDDITPLRQLSNASVDPDAKLFQPQNAYRVRWNITTDTPLPPDEPTAPNPPDGAIINYYLSSPAVEPITLEVFHENGELVRRYSSDDPVFKPDPLTASVPLYWYRPPQILSTEPGMHRFVWDMHYQGLDGDALTERLPIAAVKYNTVSSPTTPRVAPGVYTLNLTVGKHIETQTLTIIMDPRVKTAQAELDEIFSTSRAIYYSVVNAREAIKRADEIHEQITVLRRRANGGAAQSLTEFDTRLIALRGESPTAASPGERRGRRGNGIAPIPETLVGASFAVGRLMGSLQSADVSPTTAQREALVKPREALAKVMSSWQAIVSTELEALNHELGAAGLPPVTLK